MHKKVIALALAAATTTTAFADTSNVNVYGQANVSFDVVNNGSAGATQGTSTNKISSNTSRLGFKGTEDLSEGVRAIWQIETLITLDGSAVDTLGTRNTFAGLGSDRLGTVLLGRNDTPYKVSTRKLDVFADTLADNRTLLGGRAGTNTRLAFDGRQTDSLTYISPKFYGVTLTAAYVAGAEQTTAPAQTKGAVWSVAGWYDAAPFYVTLAHELHDLGSPGTGTLAGAGGAGTYASGGSEESATKVGLGYKQNQFEANVVFEKTSDNLGGTGAPAFLGAPALVAGADVYGHSAYYLSVKYNIGADALKAAYSHAGDLAGAAGGMDTSANQISIGYDHSLSKRTTVYALYTKLSNGTNVQYALSSASVASGFTAASAAGADPTGFSLGLKHVF
jgi:predicted porin